MRRYLFILLGLVALGLGFAAFSFVGAAPPVQPDAQGRGALVCGLTAGPGSLDHGYVSAASDFRITRCLQETLLRAPYGDGDVEPGSAEALPTVSPDGLTYTLNIRADAKWSTGDPVMASDFTFAWMRAMLPDTASNYEIFLQFIKGAKDFQDWRRRATTWADALNNRKTPPDDAAREQAGAKDAKAEDKTKAEQEAIAFARFRQDNPWLKQASERTPLALWARTKDEFAKRVAVKAEGRMLQVTLEQPLAYFNDILAFQTMAALHQKSFEGRILNPPPGHAPFLTDSTVLARDRQYFTPKHLVCNGPYTLSDWRIKQNLRLDQNPHYWAKDKMANIRLDFRCISEAGLMYRLFRDGQIDIVLEMRDPDLTAELVQSKQSFVHNPTLIGTYFYYFNCRPEVNGTPNPMAHRDVRRALAMCVNRREVIDQISRLGQEEARTLVPTSCGSGYQPPLDAAVPYDPAAAKTLLDAAVAEHHLIFPTLSLILNPDGAHPPIATAMSKAWEDALGLRVTLIKQDWPVVLERRQKGDFWIARGGWTGDYNDPTTFLDIFKTGNALNEGAWSNKTYDALLEKAADPALASQRNAHLAQAERILLDEAPIVCFYHYTEPMLYDAGRNDLRPTARSDHRLECVRGTRR